ncbi:MCP four helix bundle domain-containing protein [Rhizobium lemnae]|uniref:MCP four helix bundle domain-containing protein n=1 Tax=Rhizobium lemnae TaxID=1214924 RepID=A0ABV8EFC4_9HYPH|nr:MCP four helix bundle domain-containing protein [Rhizobium lemnae]MCJ8510263.1 MCP four helix bundle domain-containing protein [Rhizobium lemnae]
MAIGSSTALIKRILEVPMTIRAKLFSALLVLATALSLLAVEAFYALKQQSDVAQSIVNDRVVPMEQLKKIADAYAVSIVDTVHKARAGSLPSSEAVKSVEAA